MMAASMVRWLLPVALVLGCAGDDSAEDTTSPFSASAPTTTPGTGDTATGDTANGSSDTASTATQGPGTSSSGDGQTGSTSDPITSGVDTSSGGGPDCTAPADCAECWDCAAQGPCMAAYQSCQMMAFCVPSLVCVESMCTPDGLQQDCASTCCMSCTDLMTCPMVDAAIACIEQQCAGLCGAVTCP
jgi:hypothetical protein